MPNRKMVPTLDVLTVYAEQNDGPNTPMEIIEWSTGATTAEVKRAIRREANHGNLTLVEDEKTFKAKITQRGKTHLARLKEHLYD